MNHFHPTNFVIKFCAKTGHFGMVLWHAYEYRLIRGHFPNFRHPKDFAEILLSSMHKKSFLEYAKYADKVLVRDYIKEKGLGDLLLDFYGSWERAEDIDFSKLPDKFALKPNNGSGGHFFCHDKSKLDIEALIPRMNKSLDISGDAYAFERHYACIKPQIYCEELMDTGTDKNPTDYKFTCIKGKVADIFIAEEGPDGKRKYATVDTNWEFLDHTKKEFLLSSIPPKPKRLAEMLHYAEILSADFDIVRVDLYEFNDKVYFGELTFSPWGGMMYSYTDAALLKMGDMYYGK